LQTQQLNNPWVVERNTAMYSIETKLTNHDGKIMELLGDCNQLIIGKAGHETLL
jgi:hypothetical protein